MERLTISNSNGSVSVPALVRDRDLAIRLAAYEGTGLEPEEIGKLKAAYDENHDPSSLVKRGRWRFCGADRWNDTYQCSECGKMAMDDSNFCTNCGARMQEE